MKQTAPTDSPASSSIALPTQATDADADAGAGATSGDSELRVFVLHGNQVQEASLALDAVPAGGFVWIACTRDDLGRQLPSVQASLQRLAGVQLVDLHVSDLLNAQLPSHYDYTAKYDLLVFRRLAAPQLEKAAASMIPSPAVAAHALASGRPGADSKASKGGGAPLAPAPAQERGRQRSFRRRKSSAGADDATRAVLQKVDTSPVGFAVFDQVLLSVHPKDCSVRDSFAARLLANQGAEARANGARAPAGPADQMLRIVNLMVDSYLELRRELNQQLDSWQAELLQPKARFNDWSALLNARLSLHQLDQICEDQRSAMQDWIDALETWPATATPDAAHDRDLLKVRSRDVLEHIERVVHHVQRLEQSSETAVQLHFSLQSNRTNDIMRVLTTLTAVFLPLNLIAGIFGMNFESIPLLHKQDGFWWAMGSMGAIALALIAWFWRKNYLAQPGR